MIARVAVPLAVANVVPMTSMIMTMPDLNLQQIGQEVPLSSPQPGTFGGGGSPTDNSIISLPQSLALVPTGATPVTVFPPFAT